MKIANWLLLMAVIIWGWTFVATKICLAYLEPQELLALRLLLAAPTLLIIGIVKRGSFNVWSHRWPLLLGSLIITIHFLVQITGIKYTSATNSAWIISLTPLIVSVLAFFILKEKVGRNIIIGIIIATVGIILLISKGDLRNLSWFSSRGDWLVLVSAHTWAFYTIVTRNISRRHDPLIVTFAILLPPAILMTVIVGATSDWHKFAHLPPNVVIALLFLGVIGMALANWFWQSGMSKVGATRAGTFLYLEPVATTALAVPYLREPLGIFTIMGGLMVLAGVWIAQRRSAGGANRISRPAEMGEESRP